MRRMRRGAQRREGSSYKQCKITRDALCRAPGRIFGNIPRYSEPCEELARIVGMYVQSSSKLSDNVGYKERGNTKEHLVVKQSPLLPTLIDPLLPPQISQTLPRPVLSPPFLRARHLPADLAIPSTRARSSAPGQEVAQRGGGGAQHRLRDSKEGDERCISACVTGASE